MAQAQPIVTVDEIDEALWWVTITAPRDRHYGRIVDALLDQRNRLRTDLQDQAAPRPAHPQSHEDRPVWDSTGSRRRT